LRKLLGLGGGSRLLRSILDLFEALVDSEDELEELLSGVSVGCWWWDIVHERMKNKKK